MPGGNCNTKAGDLVGVAEVTDLFVFGRNGQRCDSDIQRAVRNPVQQTLKVPAPEIRMAGSARRQSAARDQC